MLGSLFLGTDVVPVSISSACKFSVSSAGANALENAFSYVRRTMLDVRFINNVRVAQIFSDH